MFALIEGMRVDMENNLINYISGDIKIEDRRWEKEKKVYPLHWNLDWPTLKDKLEKIDEISSFVPRINFPSSIYINEKNYPALALGLDFELEKTYQDLNQIVVSGRLPKNDQREIIIGYQLAQDLNIKEGDRITTLAQTANRGSNAISFTVVGLANFPITSMNSTSFLAPLSEVQYFLKMDQNVQQILIKYEGNRVKGASLIDKTLEDENLTISELGKDDYIYSMMKVVSYSYYLIALFFFILASTVIANTTMMAVFERMQEIGTLRALGAYKKEITTLFLYEALISNTFGAVVGSILGTVISLIFAKVGINFTDAMSGVEMNIGSIIYPHLHFMNPILVALYAIVITSLATLIPSRKGGKIEIVEAMKYV